jgi:hypothetical protein
VRHADPLGRGLQRGEDDFDLVDHRPSARLGPVAGLHPVPPGELHDVDEPRCCSKEPIAYLVRPSYQQRWAPRYSGYATNLGARVLPTMVHQVLHPRLDAQLDQPGRDEVDHRPNPPDTSAPHPHNDHGDDGKRIDGHRAARNADRQRNSVQCGVGPNVGVDREIDPGVPGGHRRQRRQDREDREKRGQHGRDRECSRTEGRDTPGIGGRNGHSHLIAGPRVQTPRQLRSLAVSIPDFSSPLTSASDWARGTVRRAVRPQHNRCSDAATAPQPCTDLQKDDPAERPDQIASGTRWRNPTA